MNIIICGGGDIGGHTAELLASEGHDITVIDEEEEHLQELEDAIDLATLCGHCCSATVLGEAGVDRADALIAVTGSDEMNLLAASVASYLGADKSIARVHHSMYFDKRRINYERALSIDHIFCPEQLTALSIASRLRNPGAMAVERLSGHAIEMQQFRVQDSADALGRNLNGLDLPSGTRVAAIRRGAHTFLPDADSTVEPGDTIVLVANSDVFHEARRIFSKDDTGHRNIVIMGGPPMAVWLCRTLRNRGFSIRLFETNRERAEELAEKLDWVTVIQADPTNPADFEGENIDQADAFVALTDDEHNILSCAWAQRMGVAAAFPLVRRTDYKPLVESTGLTSSFSPRAIAGREISRMLDDSAVRRLASLADGFVDVFKIRIGADASVTGRRLGECDLVPDCMVVAVEDDRHQGFLPEADYVFTKSHTVCVVVRSGFEKKLNKLFAAG